MYNSFQVLKFVKIRDVFKNRKMRILEQCITHCTPTIRRSVCSSVPPYSVEGRWCHAPLI